MIFTSRPTRMARTTPAARSSRPRLLCALRNRCVGLGDLLNNRSESRRAKPAGPDNRLGHGCSHAHEPAAADASLQCLTVSVSQDVARLWMSALLPVCADHSFAAAPLHDVLDSPAAEVTGRQRPVAFSPSRSHRLTQPPRRDPRSRFRVPRLPSVCPLWPTPTHIVRCYRPTRVQS